MTKGYTIIMCLLFFSVITSCEKEKEEIIIERSTVTDAEGNTYQTVKIGNRWWMAENLRSTNFSDGSPIALIPVSALDSLWLNANGPAYCIINQGETGFLYNGSVVNDARGVAPAGWRIPTDDDWKQLEAYIGMSDTEVQATGWRGENHAELLVSKNSAGWSIGGSLFGRDVYGFDALPGGCRIRDGRTNIFGTAAFWWTSTSADSTNVYRYIDYKQIRIFRQSELQEYGMSIRCVKDV
jgi:uncharacterized protein (TIGR02145 family)